MPAAAVAGAGTALSAYQAHKDGQRADEANALARASNKRQEQIAMDQLEYWQENYQPIEKALIKQLETGHTTGYGKALGGLETGLAKTRDSILANPNLATGQVGSALSGVEMEGAKARAGLNLDDAQKVDELQMNLAQLGRSGNASVSTAINGANTSTDLFSRQSAGYQQGASAAWASMAKGMEEIGKQWANGWKTPAEPGKTITYGGRN